MKNKTELIGAIGQLPKFEIKPIYLKDNKDIGLNGEDLFIEEKRLLAVTEKEDTRIITTISKNYRLIQMEEVFLPIVNHFQEVNGKLKYYWGSSVIVLFPQGQEFKTDEGQEIGLIISNSVNKMIAINLNFCVLYNGYQIVLPNLKGFRHLHIGNIKKVVTDYEGFLSDIKQSWKVIVDKFSRDLTRDDIDNILGKMELGKRYNKKLNKMYEVVEGTNLKLWDFFMDVVQIISDREYKKEENKIRKLKRIAEIVYTYAVVEVL